jgi:hypothetical protein
VQSFAGHHAEFENSIWSREHKLSEWGLGTRSGSWHEQVCARITLARQLAIKHLLILPKHLGGVKKTYKLSPAKYRNNPDFRTCSQYAINLYISGSVQYYCGVLLTCGPCPGEQLLAVPQWVSSFKGEIPSLARLARIRQFDNQTWATEKTLAQKFSQAMMEM